MTDIYSWAEAMNEIDRMTQLLSDCQRGRKAAQNEAFRRGDEFAFGPWFKEDE